MGETKRIIFISKAFIKIGGDQISIQEKINIIAYPFKMQKIKANIYIHVHASMYICLHVCI